MPDRERVYVSRFSAGSEHEARRLVNALQVVGLVPDLRQPEVPGQAWAVTAAAELEPNEENLADLEAAMRAAARRSGAAYEGCLGEEV